jgi:uncharacterized repeat protein (TIGR02543 family)
MPNILFSLDHRKIINMLSKSFISSWRITISLLGQFWPSSGTLVNGVWLYCSRERYTGENRRQNTNQTSVFIIALLIALFLTILSIPAQAAPPTVNGTTFNIAETASDGDSVGTVSASDPDVGDTLTYSITAGNTNNAFAIDAGTGEITVNDASQIDYETAISFSLTVEAKDSTDSIGSATITITITDKGTDFIPQPNFSLSENAVNGTTVDTVTTTGDTPSSFSITDGNTDNAFAIDTSGKITVKNSSAIDFETKPSFSLDIKVSDGTSSSTKTVTVNITVVNIEHSIATDTPTLTENNKTVTFTITRSGATVVASSVDYSIGGTAIKGSDYDNIAGTSGATTISGTISFAADDTSKTITVDVQDDTTDESDETIVVTLSNAPTTIGYTSAIIGTNPVTTIITDDDVSLVINEIDYTQSTIAGGDFAEFIEIKNVSSATIDLSAYAVQLINSDGTSDYQTIGLSGNLDAGKYYVICADNTEVANCDNDVSPDNTDLIEDGTPNANAIAIVKGDFVVDTVSYEGDTPNYTETSGAPTDSINLLVGLSRHAGGTDKLDTNDNSNDFSLRCVTPGAVNNMIDSSECYQLTMSGPAAITEGDSGTKTLDFTVSLSHAVTSDVTVDYFTEDTSSATAGDDYVAIGTTTLTFPAGDNTDQTISVTINGDEIDEGTEESFKVRLNNASRNVQIAVPYEVYVAITDDDDAGFTVNPTSLNISEPDTSKTFHIKLNTKPTADVTVNLPPDDSLLECSLDKDSLTFTPSNWNTNQTVTVTAQDDHDIDGTQNCDIVFDIPSIDTIDPEYTNKFPTTVTVAVEDDESPGGKITESVGGTKVNEDGTTTDTYEIELRIQPTADVTVALSVNTSFECEITSPSTLNFTDSDWNTAQTVTVKAFDDDIDESSLHDCVIKHDFSSSTDPVYAALPAKTLTVGVVDNDTAGIIIEAFEPFIISEPDSAQNFMIKLNSMPANGESVTIGLSASNSECSVLASVTINNSDWQFGQTVTVTAVDDATTDGEQTCIVQTASATSNDPNYKDIDPDDLTVTVQDDDIPGVEVSGTVNITEGASGTYDIALYTTPTGDVEIGITSADTSQCTVSPASVTLSDKTAQTITVTAVDDTKVEGNHTCMISHAITSSADSYYPTTMNINKITANIADNDPGVIITQTGGSTSVTESGTTDTYSVALSTQPSNNVTITVAPDSQTDVDNSTLTFMNGDWSTAQTVTVTAINDTAVENNHSGTISHSSAATDTTNDAAYHDAAVIFMVDGTETADVTVNITDDDNPPAQPTPRYNLSIEKTGNGTITSNPTGIDCGEDCSESGIQRNTKFILTAAPDAGYVFESWTGDCSGTTHETTVSMNQDKTCTATFFAKSTFALTVEITGNGSVTGDGNYDEGTNTTLIATPDAGSELSGFGGDCDSAGSVRMDADKHCIVTFTQIPVTITTFPLSMTKVGNGTISSQPAGIDCGAVCEANYSSGTIVILTATPDAGWLFQEWIGDCDVNDDMSGNMIMDSGKSCEAIFIADPNLIMTNTLRFTNPAYEVNENDGTAEIGVTYTGELAGEISIDYSTVPDDPESAIAGRDYTGTNGTLVWNSGEVGEKTFTVEILDDSVVENDETLYLALGNLRGQGVELVAPDTVPLIIKDNDVDEPNTPPTTNPNLTPCSGVGTLYYGCNAAGKTMSSLKVIEKGGQLVKAIIKTKVISYGWASNVTIASDGELLGGIGTGSIKVRGRIKGSKKHPFDFRGAFLSGLNSLNEVVGTLEGTIFNNSPIGGAIQDVLLAQNTHIIGGVLKNKIMGDPDKPALLEGVTIKRGVKLNNVIIGKNVKWVKKEVSFGTGVQFTSQGFGVDRFGRSITTRTHFLGTIRAQGKRQVNGVKLIRRVASRVQLKTKLFIEAKHVGQPVELLMVGYYKRVTKTTAYMRVGKKWKVWNGKVGSLQAAEYYKSLSDRMEVPVFEGDLSRMSGEFTVYTGYRLETDQSIIYNGDAPIKFSVKAGE